MHGRFATKDVICAGLTARPLSIEPLESWIDQRDIAIPPAHPRRTPHISLLPNRERDRAVSPASTLCARIHHGPVKIHTQNADEH